MTRALACVKKEFLQFSRDRMLLLLIFWLYTAEVIMCTHALSFEVRNLHLAVYDQDRTQLSQKLVERFTATEYFGKRFLVDSPRQIDALLDAGRADMGIVIPPDFSDKVGKGRTAEVQLILSGVNSNTANAARGYAGAIVAGFSHELMVQSLQQRGIQARLPEVVPRMRIWYNPELKFRYFMVVSMIVLAGFMVGVINTAASLVREKETGTIEQLMVTPLRRHEIVLAKLVPTLSIGLVLLFPSLLIARWFGVPMEGSVALFFLASAISLIASMGIGIFVSTFARNLQQALLVSFFVLFPVMFLSGTIVPVESMPQFLQYLSLLSPVRYYMEISLGIFLKGVGLDILWPKFAMLFLFGATLFLWSLVRLRRRMLE
ncbi:MAG TPA: ABC transporter permease [Novimethylophilus sp.]|jgi:ABC-2 type transport system permease protein|uniref:ABC transporter permease n=1 Tax=Novimethylophilus sp. TaxID=2137426 RepID=UPI002F4180DB